MTTVVTKETGGTARPQPSVYVPPDRQILDSGGGTMLETSGLDAAMVADVLSACLAHERCGVHLYRSVRSRTAMPDLVAHYDEYLEETAEHVRLLEELITASGGDPHYVSAAARTTERAAAGLLESTFLLSGSADPNTAELTMLEAVMLAEAKDRANWELLSELCGQLPNELRSRAEEITATVLEQEVEHHTWARDTRMAMLLALSTSGAMSDGARARTPRRSADSTGGTEMTRQMLYDRAKELQIPGRSNMTREELAEAVETATGDSR